MFTEEAQALAKATVEAIKKISKGKWEWKPEVGGWWRLNDYVWLIKDDSDVEYCQSFPPPNIVVPLLHWEKIEEILEGMGYYFTRGEEVEQAEDVLYIKKQGLDNLRLNIEIDFRDKSRQEAVMRAVIELGKGK